MIKITLTLICFSVFALFSNAQSDYGIVKGTLIDYKTQKPLSNANISVLGTPLEELTDDNGKFSITDIPIGDHIIEISIMDYETQRYPVSIADDQVINLGVFYLINDFTYLDDAGQIVWQEHTSFNTNPSFLATSKDIFLKHAAFDFSQSFFSIRGYDAKHTQVLFNGVSMHNLNDGIPQWKAWSGLNDITRNKNISLGLSYSNTSFGNLLGSTNINTRASKMRPGLRISSSISDKNYTGSTMATYNSGWQENGLAYSISASRRWGNEGYVDATLHDAFSIFGAVEYKLNSQNSINATALYAPSRSGQTTAITERVFNEFGSKYNPYWGWQEDEKRNANIKKFEMPIFMLSHFYKNNRSSLTTNISYQFSLQSSSRLDYNDAPNPYPNYWKYLSTIHENPNINWINLYETNLNGINIPDGGAARYLIYNNQKDEKIFTLNSILNTKLYLHLDLDFGLTYKDYKSDNYASPKDLLGSLYYSDVNPFNLINGKPAKNDVLGNENKIVGDRIKYNFDLNAHQLDFFTQIKWQYDNIDFFIAGNYTNTAYQRNGKFLNQAFENNSLGDSEKLAFNTIGVKGGFNYIISPVHQIQCYGAYLTKAPLIQNSFINSRENNVVVPDLHSEKITSAEVNYHFNSEKITSRITTYISDFKEGTTVNSFFAETGSGADYFQEVVTSIDKRHLGVELGFKYQFTPSFNSSAVVAFGQHTYTNNAKVGVNFDIAGLSEDIINNTGFENFGDAFIKNYKVANGPQQVYALAFEYKNPKFWSINLSGNYFSNGYLDISTISRTNNFFNNPNDFGQPFQDIDLDLARKLLQQEKFDPYFLVNLSGGKSWRIKSTNIKIVASIHNLLDSTYKTGGYEQSRTANYAALLADTTNESNERNFGPKYWYGFGRTYFINLAFSFNNYK